MNRDMVYRHLPIWAQNLACNYEGKKISQTRYGELFWDKLKQYESRSSWDYDRLCAYRDAQLSKLILHSYNSVPYYRKLMDEGGINPECIKHIDDLKAFPILTKDIIKKNPEAFVSSRFEKKDLVLQHTSGTTGNGFVFKTTKEAICDQWAVWWRYRRSLGIEFDNWCALFGGRSVVPISQDKPPYFRWNKPCKQLYFSTYHMNNYTLKYYLDVIEHNQIKWIHGYPSAINLLADYAISNNRELHVQYITTGAENLLESQKERILSAFGSEPFQHYGLSEASANFSENPKHEMIVDEDFAAVEFANNGEGAFGIIGTNLTNFAMPFIRYNTGDICDMEETGHGRVITSLDGRKEDYLVLSDGTKIGRLDHIFKDMVNVREAQFVQETPGYAKLRIVRGSEYNDDDEKALNREIYSRLRDIKIQFEYVEKIQRTGSGKLRFVVSE